MIEDGSRTQLVPADALRQLTADHRDLIWQACLDESSYSASHYDIEIGRSEDEGSRRIEALHVTPYGRFGNLFVQMSHAIDAAEYLGVKKIFFDTGAQAPGVFQTLRPIEINGIELVAVALDVPRSETTLKGTFWTLHLLAPPEKVDLLRRGVVPSQAMFSLLSDEIRDNLAPLAENDVVAHFRGGDVFENDFNTDYVQPPFAFYRKALEAAIANGGGAVHIVYEDHLNPTVNVTRRWLQKLGRPVELHSGDLKDDLKVMFAARSIVSSYGTFVPAVMKLSPHIRRVYGFNSSWLRIEHERFRADVELKQYCDTRGGYTKHGEWKASAEQITMILAYDIEAIAEVK